MTQGNGDRLNNFIQFVTESNIRLDALIRRHDERMTAHEMRMAAHEVSMAAHETRMEASERRMSAHEERIRLLENTQAGIQRILDRLTGGNNA